MLFRLPDNKQNGDTEYGCEKTPDGNDVFVKYNCRHKIGTKHDYPEEFHAF